MFYLKSLECQDDDDLENAFENGLPKAYSAETIQALWTTDFEEVHMLLNRDWCESFLC